MAANSRPPLDSKWTLIHLETLISRSSGCGLCLNMDVHWDWPVALDLFHTYTHPPLEFTTTLVCSPWPSPCRPLFSDEKKWKEMKRTRLRDNFSDEIGDGWWKECRHGGKQAAEGEVRGSYSGSLYRYRCVLVQLVCWLALLIEQVISVIGWLHSEVRSNWDISLITNLKCAQKGIQITPMGKT